MNGRPILPELLRAVYWSTILIAAMQMLLETI